MTLLTRVERLAGQQFSIRRSMDVESISRRGMMLALAIGFSQLDARRIAMVISELGRNIEHYAGRGSITLIPRIGKNRCIEVPAFQTWNGFWQEATRHPRDWDWDW